MVKGFWNNSSGSTTTAFKKEALLRVAIRLVGGRCAC